MSNQEVGLLTLSGFNQRAVVALCRYGRGAGVPIHLVTRDAADPIYLTAYSDHVLCRRERPQLDADEVCSWIGRLRERHGYRRVLIAPCTEFFNRFILSHRDEIESVGGTVPLVGPDLYEAVSDKLSFAGMCRHNGIAVPAEFEAPPSRYPFVAKPIRYAALDGRQLKPYLIMGASDWKQFEKTESLGDFYFQAYQEGRSIYLLMYVPAEGPALKFSQENLIQQRAGGSIILSRRHGFHLTPEADRYEAMLRSEGFRGLIMVEVRQREAGVPSVMIEANPRMWGPMQFALDNRIDLFGAMIRDFTGWEPPACPVPPPPVDGGYYFWSGGLRPGARPLAFHGYSPAEFLDDFDGISRCDLFARDDSRALYQSELTD
ncbi:MAG: hypothetical protein QM674_16920 [Burkholderiaceae bacterium]